jgi:hypothetical protein
MTDEQRKGGLNDEVICAVITACFNDESWTQSSNATKTIERVRGALSPIASQQATNHDEISSNLVDEEDRAYFNVITITESGAGRASGYLGALAGVKAGKYALVDEQFMEEVSSPGFPHYQAAVLRTPGYFRTYQARVASWMRQCFNYSLYSNMIERGDRLLEEVLELLQSHGYDKTRVPWLVEYVYGRPVGNPGQEVGGVMVTLAGYCYIADLNMHAEGERELNRINQPEVMAKIRAKQQAKNALHFDTPLPGNAGQFSTTSLAKAVEAFQLAELDHGERMARDGLLFDPALGVEAGLRAALPHLIAAMAERNMG